MRAVYINHHGDVDKIEIGERPIPKITGSQVLVRLKASALNHLDVWVRRGLPFLKLKYPHILGSDGAGVIEKIGEEVTHVTLGEEVIVHPGVSCMRCEPCLTGEESLCRSYKILGEHIDGTYCEYVKVPGANVFSKPANLTLEEAAAVPLVFTTAWHMLVRRAQIRPGEVVLVHAAGSGVSSAAIQIARLYNAEVIATAGSDNKLELAMKLGAHHTVNYNHEDFADRVKLITGKRGVDTIIDHTGSDLWDKNLKALKWGGKIVVCGATSGYEAVTDLRQVFFRQLQILGSTMGSKGDFGQILHHLSRRALRPVLDKSFPLEQAREAHRYLENREQFGKVLLTVD